MKKDVSQVKTVLALLPTPAFTTDGETVLWTNDACARLPLRRGDDVKPLLGRALPLLRERSGDDAAHLTLGVGDTQFDATVQRVDGEELVLLSRLTGGDGVQMRTVAEGIRPALSELIAVGSKLFPYLEEAEDERLQEQTAAMAHACFRLLRTVGALQFFDRVCEGVRSAPAQTDLTALLRTLTEHTADILRDAKITLRASLPDRPVSAFVDGAAIEYAVLQLIARASARCGDDRTVELTAAAEGRRLRICVSDSGDAAADTLAEAFSPLRSADDGGIGLALPIARAVAQQHGGSVLAECGEGGERVTMTVDLTAPAPTVVSELQAEYRHGYDAALVELSGVLPPQTFDSRNVDL